MAEDESLELDLVVTDVVMRDLDGFDLVRRLRVSRPGLAALFMSGYLPSTGQAAAAQTGALVLAKPFDLEDLADAIAGLLEARPPR